jgi:hypothetical protein
MENKIEIYQTPDNNIEISVQIEAETVWLTQEQMATLFGKARNTITEHIQNVFKEGELEEKLVCRDFRHTTQHGAIKGKTQTQNLKLYNPGSPFPITIGIVHGIFIFVAFRDQNDKFLNDLSMKFFKFV